VLLRVVEADRVIPVRPRGRAGCTAGPVPSRVGSREEPFLPGVIQQTSCFAGTGRAAPRTHVPGFGGTSFPAKAVNRNSLRVPCTESALGHTPHPGGGQKQKARPRPPAASKLGPRGGTSSGAGAGNPPLSGTKQGPQCLKSGFASCFSQGPGASRQLPPRMFCSPRPQPLPPHWPARIDQGTGGVGAVPSPAEGLASAKCASPLWRQQVQKANCRHYDELFEPSFCF